MPIPARPRGQLMIWTDVDPVHEPDFNRWYDREHMHERVALPGFRSARRLRALTACARPYLALYLTDDIEVFDDEAYRTAFAHQTDWSRRNFQRMRGTQRRVGEIVAEAGEGEGGVLAMVVVPPQRAGVAELAPRLADIVACDHVIRASMLRTDPARSAPLTADAPAVAADAVITIEATRPAAALGQALALAQALGLEPGGIHAFQLLWRLGREDLPGKPQHV